MKKKMIALAFSLAMLSFTTPTYASEIENVASEEMIQSEVNDEEDVIQSEANVESGVIDSKAPEISNISFSQETVEAPGELEIIADISDDVSGVRSASIQLYCQENEKTIHVSFVDSYYDNESYEYKKYEDGKWHAKVTLDENQQPGNYVIYYIDIYDNASNEYYVYRDTYGTENAMPDQFKNMSITVKNEKIDSKPPVISSIEFSKDSVEAPGEFEVIADISDDISGVESASIQLYCQENEKTIYVSFVDSYYDYETYETKKYEDGKWHAKVVLNEDQQPGEYIINQISLYDNAQNQYNVYRSGDYDDGFPEQYKNLSLTVINDKVDTEAPVISNISFSKDSIDVPAHLEVTADISDDISGIRSASIELRCEENNKYIWVYFYDSYYDYESGEYKKYPDGKWHCELNINHFQQPGKYKISYISIYDNADNNYYAYRTDYDSEYDIPDEFKDIVLTVNNDGLGADFSTGTSSKGYISLIENADNNAQIAVDYTNGADIDSSLFDAIRGTDKTVLFEGNGYQWKINGKDVVNDSKDINLSISSYNVTNGYSEEDAMLADTLGEQRAIVYKFANNGVLPGKMTIRIKADYALRDYMGTSGLYVYYFDTEKKELVSIASDISITDDYYIEFTIEHCSEYVLSKGAVASLDVDCDGGGRHYDIRINGGTFDGNKYMIKGKVVKNAFLCDGTYTYYLQFDGTPMKNRLTYHPDGEHIIYFDSEGHEVFSNFANVKHSIAGDEVDDLCFFNVYGYMYVDKVTYDEAGVNLYYVNPYGVIERNKWFQFSDTVKYADGNDWNGAAGNYGYANADGTLMVNQTTYDWMGRICYMQGNGVALYQ